MLAIFSLVVILTVSLLITRIATVALTLTGLSKQSARFQARSAFTGVGFTTSESERVVSHPVRRRILMLLMLLGNVGLVSAMSSLIISFISLDSIISMTLRIVLLVTGIVLLWAIAASQWVEQWLAALIRRLLKKHTQLDTRDYARLLHLAGEYGIDELQVEPGDWLAEKTLAESGLKNEGVMVLGIERVDGSFIGGPDGETEINPEDILILYGRTAVLRELDERKIGIVGDIHHQEGVARQQEVKEAQKQEKKEENKK
jgi:hypothetical protein